ncbi:periplasmic heavy metal sensor [Mesorhizobium sp. BAC0120]|uniref:periplasmic heavy metal sensor n=1 Tax=Mesorhizobium sp. BAC0120 TaxID=3090670 RepID=UPI00298BF697|nr:periplasmic heavy metal sensor [Mesorhizobium sp. BAC0120]MDW6026320.1 periplasmic heavy metal sensor [Mesorhizobium sp. BAC0120]
MSDRLRNILLAVSLAINVFIVGAAAGGGFMWYAMDRSRTAQNQGALRFVAADLPLAQRRAFLQALGDARRASISDLETARASRDDLARLLSQDRLDKGAIDAELVKIRNADMALRSRLEQAVVDFAETLSPAERQTLVEALRQRASMLRRTPARNSD